MQKLGTFGPLRCHEMYALDRLLREAQVLEIVCQLTEERLEAATSAAGGKGGTGLGGQEVAARRQRRLDSACPRSGAVLHAEGRGAAPLGPLRGAAQRLHLPCGAVPAGAQRPVCSARQRAAPRTG